MTNQTFDLSGPMNLECRIGFGNITVRADDNATQAIVTLTARAAGSDVVERTTVEMRGPTLVVSGPRPRGGLFDVARLTRRSREHDAMDVDVTVPSGTAMRISSHAADIAVNGRSGGADITAGGATVRLDEVDGDLRVRCGSGPASVRRVTGSAVVKYGSGTLNVGEVGGVLDVECGSGSLQVGVARAAVRLRTGSGGAAVDVAEGDVDLTSGSGDLSIGLRPGHAARIDVLTGSGRLLSELAVEDVPPSGADPTVIRARTGSGDIHLRRAAEVSGLA
jgi:ferric-dicitrate binding protein FerR (iron transport regulator)